MRSIKQLILTGHPGFDLKTLQQFSQQRLENDNTFQLIKENTEWLSKQNDKHYSLRLDKYKEEQKAIRTTIKQLEALLKLKERTRCYALPKEVNRWENDKNKQERFEQWLKGLQKDIYLDQAVKVMNDMIRQQNLVKAKKKPRAGEESFLRKPNNKIF